MPPSRFIARLVAGILALNLIVVMLVALTLYESRQQHEKLAELTAQNLSRLLEHDLAASFDKLDLTLLTVADEVNRLRGSGRLDASVLNAFIVRQAARLPELSDLRIADAQGNLRYGKRLLPDTLVNVADREFFIRLRDHPDAGLVVSKAIVSRTSGKWQLALTRRLNQPDGSFAGTVVAVIELDKITGKFAALDIGRRGIVNLYDHELAMVTRYPALENDKTPIGQKIISRQFEEQLRIAPEAGVFHAISPLDKLERTFSYRKIPDYPFYLLVGLATDDYLGEWWKDVARNGVLMAVFALVTLGFAWLMVRAWKRLKQQEQKFRTLLESSPDPLVIADAKGLIALVNRQVVALFGYEPEELVGQPVDVLLPQRYHGGHAALRQGYTQAPQAREMGSDRLLWAVTRQGREVPVNVSLSPIHTEQGLMVAASIRDISESKAAEAKIKRLSDFYAAVNQCRQAIVRCTSEDELFPQICRAAVQFGGMKMAWIGFVDETSQMVRPVACYGTGTEYLEGIQISVKADEPSGRGGSGTAIRENRPVWNQDFQKDPRLAPWRERGARAGWRSTAALPLSRKGKVIGAFNLYAGEVNAFNETVCNLLMEMTRDIGHALDNYSLQAERKQAEEELHIAAAAFESQQGMMITDAQSVILRVNHAFTEITGYTAGEAVGQTPRLLQSGRHSKDFYHAMWETIHRTGGWQGEIWDRRKNGEIYPKWLTITAVKSDDGAVTNYVGTHTDITARKATEDQLHNLAFYDPLTQLPNRRLILERLDHTLASCARNASIGAILFLDLDNFKTLNDTQGHDVGDQLLIEVAHRLKTSVRQVDTVARLGGDEFLILLEELEVSGTAALQAEAVAMKILKTLSRPFWLEQLAGTSEKNVIEFHGSASIGITLFGASEERVDELLKQADLAMYQSKTAGRNTLRFFDQEMQAIVTDRAALEADLREAVRQQQFVLYYQPQVGGDDRLTGAEALVRWQHPQRGMVSPAEFIPLTEDNGLVLPLGLWVLETACSQLAVWATRPETSQLNLAVNISAKQLHQPDFVETVLAVLGRTGANPRRLKLELTESLLVSNVETSIAKMTALKAHGVGFALDDFGTGYSSLSYLKRLPLDQLKIDQGFVRDILIDPNDAAIARMVIALAGSLGLTVIAEGVETGAQRDFLARLGCHAYQGYLFSRPLPLDEFEEFVKRV